MNADAAQHPLATLEAFWLGPLRVDLAAYTAGDDALSEQEVALLRVLLEAEGAPVARLALYREVWGYRSEPQGRALDFAVRRLRAKLGDTARSASFLQTVRGVGFRLVDVRPDTPSVVELPRSPVPLAVVPPREVLAPLAPRTPLVGRTEECEELADLLASGARLINLVGPGGVGKTRLAVEVLGKLDRPLAVADLSALEPGGKPLQDIAAALGLAADQPGPDDVISAALRGTAEVLLLDRCEHLAATLAPLLDLLLAHTSLTVVATSRHRLGLEGEVLFDVVPLETPAAVALLVDRCRAFRRNMRLRSTDPVAHRIVDLLDGLPLAIELTAARLRASSPLQVERRLRERIPLGSEASDPLVEAIAWSWGLLPEDLQGALSVLHCLGSVVRPEHAQRVLAPLGDPERLLVALVDRSWLQPAALEPFQYRFLTPTHRWLQAHAPDPAPAAATAFLDLCAESIEQSDYSLFAGSHLDRARKLAERTRHEALLPLTQASLRWSALGKDPSEATALVERVQHLLPSPSLQLEISLCWMLLGGEATQQARDRLAAILAEPGLTEAQRVRCRWAQARAFKNLGQLDRALATAREAAAAALALGALREAAGAHSLLIELCTHAGDLQGALVAGRTTLGLAEQLERDPKTAGQARALTHSATLRLAPLYLMEGDTDTARRLFARTTEWRRAQGLPRRLFEALCNQALLEAMAGAPEAAEQHLLEASSLGDSVLQGYNRVQFHIVRSKTSLLKGNLQGARSAAEVAVRHARAMGAKALALALQALAWVHLVEGRLSSGAAEECWELAQQGGLRLVGCQAAGVCAWLAARRQDPERALALAREAEQLADFSGPADEQVLALAGAALGYAVGGAPQDADRAMHKAAAVAEALSHIALIADLVPTVQAERARLERAPSASKHRS